MVYQLVGTKSISVSIQRQYVQTDLKVWNISLDKTTVYVGEPITLTIHIETTSGDTLINVKYEVYMDNSLIHSDELRSLGGGVSKDIDVTIDTSGMSPGKHTIMVKMYKELMPAI